MSYAMSDLLQLVVSEGASDLHVRVGTAPTIRVHGTLHRVEGPSLSPEGAEDLMRSITSEEHIQQVRERGGADFAFAFGEAARLAEDAGGAGGEQLDQAREADAAGVVKLVDRQGERRFEADHAEGGAIEFDVLAGGLVRGVVGGDGVNRAIGEACEKSVAVGARGDRRIHLEAAVVADVFVGEREMVRSDFAGDRQAGAFRLAHQR